jgi:invasion protein IalB
MAHPRNHLAKWLPVVLLMIGPTAAVSQEAEAPAAPPAAESPWAKVCNKDPSNGKELCLVIQEIRADTGQFIASATIRILAGEEKMTFIAAVPTGMLIQPGMRAQIDGGKQYELKYSICFPNACYADLEIDDAFVKELKGGGQLTVTTMNQQAKPVNFPMTLAGFTKAFDSKGLDAAAVQQRQNELAEALARRAETTRQKLIEQQQKESGEAN